MIESKPTYQTKTQEELRQRVKSIYSLINNRGLYVNTNHDVFIGNKELVDDNNGGAQKYTLLKKGGQAYASPLLFATLTSLLKHGTMLLTGAPGIGKTTGAEYAGHFFSGQSLNEILQATIQGHPQQTEEKMIGRYHVGDLLKEGKEQVMWRKFMDSQVKIIDEINRLDPDKINIVLRLIDTGIATYGDEIKLAKPGPLFATANYDDSGTHGLVPPAKDRFDVAVVVTSPQHWDINKIFNRGDEKLNGGIEELLKIDESIQLNTNDYETIRKSINSIPMSDEANTLLTYTMASIRFSEVASDDPARMTKGNIWASNELENPHFADGIHLHTYNELSIRRAKAIKRYAKALAWLCGKEEVDKEIILETFPYCTWHTLEPSDDKKNHKKMGNDRIAFAKDLIKDADTQYSSLILSHKEALAKHELNLDILSTGKFKDKELSEELLLRIAKEAISNARSIDLPIGISLAKEIESTHNEAMMKR